jgi:hypothetical protein
MSGNFLRTIDRILVQLGTVIFSLIGIVGNSLIFYILTKKKFLKESIFRYFIVSEIISCIALIFVWT